MGKPSTGVGSKKMRQGRQNARLFGSVATSRAQTRHRPSLRDGSFLRSQPSTEVLGYYHDVPSGPTQRHARTPCADMPTPIRRHADTPVPRYAHAPTRLFGLSLINPTVP
jgi:hypothetical protein